MPEYSLEICIKVEVNVKRLFNLLCEFWSEIVCIEDSSEQQTSIFMNFVGWK